MSTRKAVGFIWYQQQRHRTGTFTHASKRLAERVCKLNPSLHFSPPKCLLPSQWISVLAPTFLLPQRFTAQSVAQGGTWPIWYVTLHFKVRRSAASLRNSERKWNVWTEALSGVVWTWLKWQRKSLFKTLSLRFFMVDLFFRLDGLLRLSPRPAGESYGSLLSYLLGKIR